MNGPKRSCLHQLLQIHWAHPWSSAAFPKGITGPKHSHQHKAAAANALGPNETISGILLEIDSGPTRKIQPLSLDGPIWAFPSSSVKLHMGFIDYYNKLLVHYVSTITSSF